MVAGVRLIPPQRCHKKTHEAEPEKQFYRTFLIPPQLKMSHVTLRYTIPTPHLGQPLNVIKELP